MISVLHFKRLQLYIIRRLFATPELQPELDGFSLLQQNYYIKMY